MNANNVPAAGKSYVTNAFEGSLGSTDGNKFIFIISLDHYLETLKVDLSRISYQENVNIDSLDDRVAPIANVIKNNATIENVKVTGSVVGNNDVAG